MNIPFYANDSEPGSRIKCTTGDIVTVYTKPGATWISEGSLQYQGQEEQYQSKNIITLWKIKFLN